MVDKQAKLDAIKAQIVADNVTPDLAAAATQLVFGEGNPDAKIVFIGEAPGKNEDLTGKPFVGAAGKFLNEMLASIGMKREDIYITNIVKYRPPDNRDPLPEEKKAFLPYLQQQLEVIRPLVVATLGRHPLSGFLPDLQIGKVHGQPKRIRLRIHELVGDQDQPDRAGGQGELVLIILPLFHPAAALYNGSMRATLIEDFARIPAVLEHASS